ncbi:cryptochrome/photolyase family protein [Paracoccus sp. R12_1]|uniref:cryptochrome/photolyase family protein n=1 Tax=unclassified Paracoccus (in: a-proteobacteria) TaxID=2688777 RepID=UPI001AD989F3|nr:MULTISPECIES: cryptochrome/photolyase family protein [unclassified Paracoccus (in: a-proteobacteria)]MBO9454431.1 cryptochrome/photolyase family protein [Paracoccus sp. R12_2]MBO9485217.1 cryptochrome/photolyase family protein [Paracoccus sp. R12_1]
MTRLILVLGDQLSRDVAALREAGKDDVIVMAEVMDEASYVRHHPKKIAFLFAAMRKFAARLADDGFRVAYTRLDDPDNSQKIGGELLRRAAEFDADEVIATEPGEWRLIDILTYLPIKVHQRPDDRFFASHDDFDTWARDRKELRMEWFYRDMRRKTGLLMDGDQPVGGKWNHDHDNRKPADVDMFRDPPPRFAPDAVTNEVLDLVAARFPDNFGDLRPFDYATDRDGALTALQHFISHSLDEFGPYQDAMLRDDPHLHHSVLSPYLNAGLLSPREVCEAAARAHADGKVRLNSAEGFIRQILGWREYMRGIYFREGPDYTRRNALNHRRKLPWMYWGGKTRMACMAATIGQTGRLAYAHHIQRLMVTGNFALLAGIDPAEVHEWYLSVYIDAYEWVEAPNTIGMSQFADGGIVGSKPYVSSGNYINKMSDYCGDCAYSVTAKTGQNACPFNLLYWDFLVRHRDRFEANPRMSRIYSNWDRMDADKRRTIRSDAAAFLRKMSDGAVV